MERDSRIANVSSLVQSRICYGVAVPLEAVPLEMRRTNVESVLENGVEWACSTSSTTKLQSAKGLGKCLSQSLPISLRDQDLLNVVCLHHLPIQLTQKRFAWHMHVGGQYLFWNLTPLHSPELSTKCMAHCTTLSVGRLCDQRHSWIMHSDPFRDHSVAVPPVGGERSSATRNDLVAGHARDCTASATGPANGDSSIRTTRSNDSMW